MGGGCKTGNKQKLQALNKSLISEFSKSNNLKVDGTAVLQIQGEKMCMACYQQCQDANAA